MSKVLVSGHRPDKISKGYYLKTPIGLWLKKEIKQALIEMQCTRLVCGGAMGTDTIAALAALELKIPLTVAVPFMGQDERWPATARLIYKHILQHAATVEYIHKAGPPAEPWEVAKLYDKRNEWMIDYILPDPARKMLTVYDGSTGGTHNCIKLARYKIPRIEITNINPRNFVPGKAIA